ncbi:hypothetical protein N7508_007409 [Penicillium antarcticum]|nr:uncharacterized protein N7508_007409 [Penicillium antarcticum]KAJ5300166.1 hypothetical protein N7508_007409 [Penicillium antarcticum]
MLKKLQARDPPLDIDKYFDTPPITVTDITDQNWLCNWWKMHKDEYPRMAAAATDYLAIPASEVGVERVHSEGCARHPEIFFERGYFKNADVVSRWV